MAAIREKATAAVVSRTALSGPSPTIGAGHLTGRHAAVSANTRRIGITVVYVQPSPGCQLRQRWNVTTGEALRSRERLSAGAARDFAAPRRGDSSPTLLSHDTLAGPTGSLLDRGAGQHVGPAALPGDDGV